MSQIERERKKEGNKIKFKALIDLPFLLLHLLLQSHSQTDTCWIAALAA
jgi:hypothetical protein